MSGGFEAADFGFSEQAAKEPVKRKRKQRYLPEGKGKSADTGFSAVTDTVLSEAANSVNSFASAVAETAAFVAGIGDGADGNSSDSDKNDISDDLTGSIKNASEKAKDKTQEEADKTARRIKQARRIIYEQHNKEVRARYQGRDPDAAAQSGAGSINGFSESNDFAAGADLNGTNTAGFSPNGAPGFASNANQFEAGGLFSEANISGDFERKRQRQRMKSYAERSAAAKRTAKLRASKLEGRDAKKKAETEARRAAQKAGVKNAYKKAAVSGRGIGGGLARGAGAAANAGAREGAKAGTEAGVSAAAETGAAAGTAAAGSGAAAGGWVTLIIIAVLLILAILLGILLVQAFAPATAAFVASGGAYQSEAEDIDSAEEMLQLLEVDLKKTLLDIEDDYPDYDEYEYDPEYPENYVGHNPWTLINYLSALHISFTKAELEAEIQDLFDAMYELKLEEKTETRIRYVVDYKPLLDEDGEPVIDEETGEPVMEEYLTEEEYTVDILCISLTVKSLETVVSDKLSGNEDAKSIYEIYQETKGLRQVFDCPIEGGIEGKISSYYGWRIHPITKEKKFHKGLDIAVPEGTPVHSAQDGKVVTTGYDEAGYGYFVIVENDEGYKSLYAHLSGFTCAEGDEVKSGDIIALSGNTGGSTGPHLHLEVFFEGKNYNPLFYVDSG